MEEEKVIDPEEIIVEEEVKEEVEEVDNKEESKEEEVEDAKETDSYEELPIQNEETNVEDLPNLTSEDLQTEIESDLLEGSSDFHDAVLAKLDGIHDIQMAIGTDTIYILTLGLGILIGVIVGNLFMQESTKW